MTSRCQLLHRVVGLVSDSVLGACTTMCMHRGVSIDHTQHHVLGVSLDYKSTRTVPTSPGYKLDSVFAHTKQETSRITFFTTGGSLCPSVLIHLSLGRACPPQSEKGSFTLSTELVSVD